MSGEPENRPSAGPGRTASGKWAPGHSPNPGGRPKALTAVVEAARKEGVASIMALVAIRDDVAAAEAARIAAARELLDRGFGKATVGMPGDEGEQISRVEFVWAKEGEE